MILFVSVADHICVTDFEKQFDSNGKVVQLVITSSSGTHAAYM